MLGVEVLASSTFYADLRSLNVNRILIFSDSDIERQRIVRLFVLRVIFVIPDFNTKDLNCRE